MTQQIPRLRPPDGPAAGGAGLFSRAYRRGVTEALRPPGARLAAGRLVARAARPAGAFALHGSVLTPAGAVAGGYVTVADGMIAEVGSARPAAVPVLATGGVILPGLIDLHGHPEFNVFAAWEPPRLFANRYLWRGSDLYHQLVRDPQNLLLTALPAGTELRYAEVRALVGGVTAIQGASGGTRSPGAEPLVRNVDQWIFGQHRARAMIDLPSGTTSRDFPRLRKILTEIAAGTVDAFYLHLCEGQRGDQRSQSEFARFLSYHADTPATVLIHASALSADQLRQLAAAGCKLVWSPQSNLRLYGQTTLAAEAIRAGMPVALGADWLPSGSTSLLAEMKVARRELLRQGLDLPAADLVRMVTAGAAAIAGLADHLGALQPGRPADLVVLERHHDDPYENVCQADPSWVDLVLIGGDITYGRSDWYAQLAGPAAAGTTIEPLTAWGKPMQLDTGFQSPAGSPAPPLSSIKTALITAYPQVGPIFA
jgi:cytosine/adenosine deaminase-related metal-dependent hydrolase